MTCSQGLKHYSYKLTKYERILIVVFLFSLPLCNPLVHGDGVGYYAYARSMLIEHSLNFDKDWTHGNESFELSRVDASGNILADQYTQTRHLINIWTIGPAILWSPFLIAAHLGVLLCDKLGAHIAADGFSPPYLFAMAFATALYGFLGLWISFRLSRKYLPERWAFLATLGIWWGSSLPVYMYFNPSWSHAHSAFIVALFLWYWHRTRGSRTVAQWIVLGVISGLMVDIYYPNGVLLLIPLLEALRGYRREWTQRQVETSRFARDLLAHLTYFVVFLIALLPTFISRAIIFGSPFATGYPTVDQWNWQHPALWNVLFSSDHGIFSWTPILLLATIGIFFFHKFDKMFAYSLMVSTVVFYAVVALHLSWDGLSSYGNRFFISLTPIFILGLATLFDFVAHQMKHRRAAILCAAATSALVLWNLGLMYQWGTHLIPVRGPISFRDATYNQFAVVPMRAGRTLVGYFTRRKIFMKHVEQEDLNQLKQSGGGSSSGHE
jgi:hypothetical protein